MHRDTVDHILAVLEMAIRRSRSIKRALLKCGSRGVRNSRAIDALVPSMSRFRRGGSIVKSYLMLTAAALLCAPAFAQDQPQAQPSVSSVFAALDANKDGRISKEEAQAHPVVSQGFAAADSNSDGAITNEEFSASFTTRSQTTPPPVPSSEPAPPR
jgi:hypothetical protein